MKLPKLKSENHRDYIDLINELKDLSPDDFIDKVYESQSKESCKVNISYHGSPSCHVYMEGVLIADEELCLLSVVDISNFK